MSQVRRRILFRPASVLLLGALAMLLAQSVAHAQAPLTISGGTPEAIGDPGGTNFNNPVGSAAGKGLPTAGGGWQTPPGSPVSLGSTGFAQDPSFSNALGISGFSTRGGTTPLTVSLDIPQGQTLPVSFTFFGKGNSSLNNQFQVNGQTLFGPGPPSTYSQGLTETFNLGRGPINFGWITGQGVVVQNGATSAPLETSPGFFAGVNPYPPPSNIAGTTLPTVFVGLTDLPAPGDHDFQDLGVRITAVPEPASLIMGSTAALMGLGCAWSRRKRASA